MAMIMNRSCPECGSSEIVATGVGSSMFMCKSCGYVGGTHDTSQLDRELGVTEDEFPDEETPDRVSVKKAKVSGKAIKKPVKKSVKKTRSKR